MLKKLKAVTPGEPQTLFPCGLLAGGWGGGRSIVWHFCSEGFMQAGFVHAVFPFVTRGNPGSVMAAGTTCGASAKEKSRTFVRSRSKVSARCFLDRRFDLRSKEVVSAIVVFSFLIHLYSSLTFISNH